MTLELLFGDQLPEFKARRAPKVSRKVHDPDTELFYEPSEAAIQAAFRHGGAETREQAIAIAQAWRAEMLAMPLREPQQWTAEEREGMEAIERDNAAIIERNEKRRATEPLTRRERRKHKAREGNHVERYEHDPVRPLRHDRSLSWVDDPMAA